MQQQPPRRSQGPKAPGPSAAVNVANEEQLLEAMLSALARGTLPPDAWDKVHEDARRDERSSELAFAFESVAQGKRLKALQPNTAAEFLFQAGRFFGDVFGDEQGAITYLERALALSPTHAGAFAKLEEVLRTSQQYRKLGEVYATLAQTRPRSEQPALLRRAAELLTEAGGAEDRLVELLQQVLRLEPADERSRDQLESLYVRANRFRDVVRLNEQALAADPGPDDETRQKLLARTIDVYAAKLREPERALPHVEQLLLLDPSHDGARRVAQKLVTVKGLASRAAAALAAAYEASGTPQQVAQYLSLELEGTRGPKRAGLLARLGRLKEERLGDDAGALEAFEQSLAIDLDDDARSRYVALALKLGRQADAAKTLTRVVSNVKDPQVRANATAQLGEVLFRCGDVKRAKTALAGVLGAPDAPAEAVLTASHVMREILEKERDLRGLADALERIATLETDVEKRREADERLSELATKLNDPARAVAAYERLLSTTARAKALEALTPLYEKSGDPVKHAILLEERAKDIADPSRARELLMRAAGVRATEGRDPGAAIATCKAIVERFGASSDVLAILLPLLEEQGRWPELADALSAAAALAIGGERAELLGRLGAIRLKRLKDEPAAIATFAEALEADASDSTARTALEKLAANGDHRLAAARLLEPIYRREGAKAPLVKTLELLGTLEETSVARLDALREAATLARGAGSADSSHTLELLALGLAEAVAAGRPLHEWLDRLDQVTGPAVDSKRRAVVLAHAIGDREVDSEEMSALARRAAEALAACGDAPSAIALFRRALAFDPHSSELLARIDDLLRDQGSPTERIALYRAALLRAGPDQRRELLHRIGSIETHDLRDTHAAIATFRTALTDDPEDADAHGALEELYRQAERWEDLGDLLEQRLFRLSGDDARNVRLKLIDLLAAQGNGERARAHCAALLGDPDLSPQHLETIERVATRLEATEIARAVLQQRSARAENAREQVAWLDRLGDLEHERRGDLDAAAAAWKRAGQIAEADADDDTARRLYSRARKVAPDDAEITARLVSLCERAGLWDELPRLYVALSHHAADDGERAELALRTARVLSDRIGDVRAAARYAGQAFEMAPARPDTLEAFEQLSVAAGTLDAFERAIDEAMSTGAMGPEADHRLPLLLARARALTTDPTRADEAARIYRAILDDERFSAPRKAGALAAFEALVARDAGSTAARLADRRWLLEWRAEHATEEQCVGRLLEWARDEETVFAEPARALALHQRILGIDPECDEALASVTRLSLETGDAEQALDALRARRDRAQGASRVSLEREIAQLLLSRTTRWDEALAALAAVLAEAPGDADARGLAAQLLAHPATRAGAVQMLERACEATEDAAVREQIVQCLLDAPVDGDPPDVRRRRFDLLSLLQRDGGRLDAALVTALRAARELPGEAGLWDRAEELTRAVSRPDDVAALYEEVLALPLSSDVATVLGERAVLFYQEWFDDPTRIVRILHRVLELAPLADWAFDRLKLLLDAGERWDDLFALYDRTLGTATGARRAALLEDAAQTAKDFADRPERATQYFEQLRELRPADAKLAGALERLYERQGKYRELVELLSARLPALDGEDARRTRARVAKLWLDELSDPSAALDAIEPLLASDEAAASGPESSTWTLLERILEATPSKAELQPSSPPPPSESGGRRAKRLRMSEPPAAVSVRQRAAAWLREHYIATGRDVDLARVLLIELERMTRAKDRVRRHIQVAELYEKVGDLTSALEQIGFAFLLDPEDDSLRERLGSLAESTGGLERLAEVLAAAGETSGKHRLRIQLTVQAAAIRADRLGDTGGAISLFAAVLGDARASAAEALGAAHRLEPLLDTVGRTADRLEVVERIANLEPDADARRDALGRAAWLAVGLEQNARAIALWERRLAADERDGEALDGLVDLLEREGSRERLTQVLHLRASAATEPTARRADLVRAGTILGDELGRADEAIEAWRAIEQEFGRAEDATNSLGSLLRATARWPELAELLARSAEQAADTTVRADRLTQLGDVQRERLDAPEAAIHAYGQALACDPTLATARAGLEAVADQDAHRPTAVAVLLDALRQCDDWQAILALTPKRLLSVADAGQKVEVLEEAARIAEQRAGDVSRAFDSTRDAFALAPDQPRLQGEVARLAEAAGAWPALVAAYRQVIEEAAPGSDALVSKLWGLTGVILEEHLGDPSAALEAYLHVVAIAADAETAASAIRVGGALRRWDVPAQVLVDLARSNQGVLADALDALERTTQRASEDGDGTGAWDAALQALVEAVSASQLRGDPARDLHARIAVWERDRRGDFAAAEAAFESALSEGGPNPDLLQALADLQRGRPDRRLIATLVALSRAKGGVLALLRESGEVARNVLDDRALGRELAGDLLTLARGRWSEAADGNDESAPGFAEWAIETLARLHEEEGDTRAMFEILVQGDALPFELEVRRGMRRRAARAAADLLGDHDRAVGLYLALFDDDPHDVEAVERLVPLYADHGRTEDLLRLRERQIAAARGPDERLALRLEAARLLTELGDTPKAVATLREGLEDSPRDEVAVEQLVRVLTASSRDLEVCELFGNQAHLSEQAGDAPRAAELWWRAAQVAEGALGDAASAAAFHERVVALEPRAGSFESLARLAQARNEPAAAAAWLEKWVEVVDPELRVEATLRLSWALVSAGQTDRATERLEQALARDPAAEAIRTQLAALYQEQGQWTHLANVVADAAAHATDKTTRLARLLEAAKLFAERCSQPLRAVPLLEQASDLAPEDQAVRLALADALARAGRYDEARTLLQALADAFGGRRPRARAPVHHQMALLELAVGNRARALVELDTASRVDPQNPEILGRLAQLARDDGQLERAEKSYRALLVILRRREEAREENVIGRGEVLLELSAIADRRGESQRAGEILETALETASQSEFEQQRLEDALRARGDDATLVRVLESRLAREGDSPAAVKTLSELADVLSSRLERPEQAFPIRMRAIAIDPRSMEAHDAALALARSLGQIARYVDGASAIADQAIQSGDAVLSGAILTRLASIAETDLGQDARAAELYERSIALGHQSADVLRALDRVYERLGDAENGARVLAMRVEAETREGGASAAGEARYRLATLRLASARTLDEGADMLAEALEVDPRPEIAEQALRGALATNPTHSRLLELYELVGRHPGHERTLVDALRLRAALPEATVDTVRRAVEGALGIGDSALAEQLLAQFADGQAGVERSNTDVTWALATRATIREAAGDLRGTVELKTRAAQTAEPEIARRLQFDAARIASDRLGDLALAAETYQALQRAEPADREVWNALADVYRKQSDAAKLADLLGRVIDFVDDVAERAKLRLERIRTLRERLGLADAEAIPLLREILDEDPAQVEAALMLAEILERSGSREDLAALLARQMEAAKDRGDAASIASLSLRLGALLEPPHGDGPSPAPAADTIAARNVYYAGLDWDPQNRGLLDALLRLLDTEETRAERADLLERRLGVERGPAAETMALNLCGARSQSGDEAGAERALVLGYRACPESATLRERLEQALRRRGDSRGLAELIVADARSRGSVGERVSRLREAAVIWRTEVGDARAAADALRIAREAAPEDAELLGEHVGLLAEAGDYAGAIGELSRAIAAHAGDDRRRAALLASRASVRATAGDARSALDDLEQAFELEPETYAQALAAQLERARATAASAADHNEVRAIRLRQAQVLPFAGDTDGALAVLTDLLRETPKDREALRTLARLESWLERWEPASAAWRRLIGLEEGDAAIEAALALAEACERAGRAGDAQGVLERVHQTAPHDQAILERLERCYEATGAWRELAQLALGNAQASGDVGVRFTRLLRAGSLLVSHAADPASAVSPLEEALALRPSDPECITLLSDAYFATGRLHDAQAQLEPLIAVHKGRRARELAPLHARVARIARELGDAAGEARALVQALECDSQNGEVCAEVAVRAMDLDQLELAVRALRAITLLKTPGPVSKAVAYQYLGEIARRQGDNRRALTLLKRALIEDPGLDDARALVEAIERGA